jgi:tetratricopeptide (TPR) repeat protein
MKFMLKAPSIGNIAIFLVIAATTLAPASDLAFTHVQLGEALPQMQMHRVGGDRESFLGPDESQARVFAFVKPDHQRSTALINIWAELQAAFVEQPVHWVLIVSDRHESGPSANWDSLAPGATILVDSGDQLYGQLGVPMTPVVGIADQEGLLQAYLPYRSINYSSIITAHVRHVLGTVSDEQLAKLLNPSGGAADSLQAAAKRKLKLAKMLLTRERLDTALAQVESALTDCPDLAEGYLLLAEIHTAAGRPEEAAQATARAKLLSNSAGAETDSSATAPPK